MSSSPVKLRSIIAASLAALLVLAAGVSGGRLTGLRTVFAAQNAAASDAAPEPTVLKVVGAVPTPLSLTADDLAKMPRSTAAVASDGDTDTYEGVLLYDILVKAGWQFGRGMVAKGAPACIVATGKDGFQAVFSLAEIDPQFSGVKVLVADKMNGLPLPNKYKPFRMISPNDKMRARSIYSLIKVEVVKLP